MDTIIENQKLEKENQKLKVTLIAMMEIINGFNNVNMEMLEYSFIDFHTTLKIQGVLSDTKNKLTDLEKVNNFIN